MFPDLTRDDVFRLETRRLWLRWPRLADVQAIVRLAGEKAVAEMTARIPHPYPPRGRRAVRLPGPRRRMPTGAACSSPSPRKGGPTRSSAWSASGRARRTGEPHLGYWLGTPHWGQGYATEAARALIDAFFAYTDERGAHRVGAGHQPGLAAGPREVRLRLSWAPA